MGGWVHCPFCGEPVAPKPENDPGCVVGFTLGFGLVSWLLLALASCAGK